MDLPELAAYLLWGHLPAFFLVHLTKPSVLAPMQLFFIFSHFRNRECIYLGGNQPTTYQNKTKTVELPSKPNLFPKQGREAGRTVGVLRSNGTCSAWFYTLARASFTCPSLSRFPEGQGLHCKQGSPRKNTRGLKCLTSHE